MSSEIRLLLCYFAIFMTFSWSPDGCSMPECCLRDPGRNETGRRKGKRQKARDTEPVPFYQENNSSPGGPTRGTSSYIHGPELGHVVTPAMMETGKANICTWAHGHPEKKTWGSVNKRETENE